jgi:Ca2+:H+ antiporter
MRALRPLERALLGLILVLTALAGLADYEHWSSVSRFVLAAFALAGLAWLVSFATEQLGEHISDAATGLLQATIGNLPELFVVIFALQKGELIVAQTTIVGSILANALLVLGGAIVLGSHRSGDGVMRFSRRLPRDSATLLQATVFIIVVLGLSLGAHDRASHHVKVISVVGAAALLVVYVAWLVSFLRGEPRTRERAARGAPRLALGPTLALLALAGAGAAFVSEWFIAALAPAVSELGISRAFAGLVIAGIADNAVEHSAALWLAWKGRADLAISIIKNSVAQIAAFVFPLLMLLSLLLATTLTFALAPVYVGALVLTALSVWHVTSDGEAVAFEGWALIALYVVVATLVQFE